MPFTHDDSTLAKTRVRSLRQLRRLPGVEGLFKLGRVIERGRHVDQLPALTAPLERIFTDFLRDGVVRVKLSELGVPSAATLEAVQPHLERLKRGQGKPFQKTSEHIPLEDLLQSPEPLLFGLQKPLLDLAERYFGLPAEYLGLDMKREIANGVEDGVRTWHFDVEDERMMKLIVYLSEVDDGAGPFEAVKGPRADRFRREVRYVWGDGFSTEQVNALVPKDEWYRGTGEALSVHVIDPVRLLHRAGPPTHRDRYSMTYSYASKRAYFAFASAREAQDGIRKRWGHLLDAGQRSAVTP